MKVVAYYRYSTDNKNQVDNSEARQRDTVERVIYRRAKAGWQLIGSYTDKAVSGTDDKPELINLREAVEKGKIHVDIIAIDELSRLSRRSLMDIGSDIQWIKDAGIKLSIASRNNGDPFTIEEFADDLSLMVDQFQNNQYVKKLSRQVTNGLRTKFAKGSLGWTGKAPYGYSLKSSNYRTIRRNNYPSPPYAKLELRLKKDSRHIGDLKVAFQRNHPAKILGCN